MAASGLLVRHDGKLRFIPSAWVKFIRYDVVTTPFPGSDLEMALLAGRVVPVIVLGREGKALVVCEVDGETVAFSGLEPLKSGFLEGNEQQLIEANEPVPLLPVQEYIAQARIRRPVARGEFEEDPWMS